MTVTLNPDVMGGKPLHPGDEDHRGYRPRLLAAGHSAEEILGAYPYLEKDDISAALSYAATLATPGTVVIAGVNGWV